MLDYPMIFEGCFFLDYAAWWIFAWDRASVEQWGLAVLGSTLPVPPTARPCEPWYFEHVRILKRGCQHNLELIFDSGLTFDINPPSYSKERFIERGLHTAQPHCMLRRLATRWLFDSRASVAAMNVQRIILTIVVWGILGYIYTYPI